MLVPGSCPDVGDSLEMLGNLQWENLDCSMELFMGDIPEENRCPAFAQEDSAAEAKKVWSCFPPIPGDSWLSLLGCPFVPHPLQGCDQHLVDLLLLWTQAGMQLRAGIPGAEKGQDTFLSIPMNLPMPQRLLWPWGVSDLL